MIVTHSLFIVIKLILSWSFLSTSSLSFIPWTQMLSDRPMLLTPWTSPHVPWYWSSSVPIVPRISPYFPFSSPYTTIIKTCHQPFLEPIGTDIVWSNSLLMAWSGTLYCRWTCLATFVVIGISKYTSLYFSLSQPLCFCCSCLLCFVAVHLISITAAVLCPLLLNFFAYKLAPPLRKHMGRPPMV